jgi:hypothetical protein
MKSVAQKPLVESGFGRKFHDHKYFKVGFYTYIFLEFIIYSRASSQNFVDNY